ncbi:glucosamine-6-phosphate deaminase [Granulicoccus sp. GXG6511]|uniref:glucosamine-6-phosphate deaminase n=1 Tax=Granulicoccus sp. GXG6511 TaxID=3381351 RepID=UPI003D7D2EFE
MRIIQDDGEALGRFATDLIAERIADRPDAVIGLATGSSPIPIYVEMARRVAAGTLDLSSVRFFALDEYVGLAADHPMSYRAFLDDHVVGPCNLDPAQLTVLNGKAADPVAECADYEQAISAAGGIDLQLLGIGHNGHIGFNEPTSSFASRTRVVALTHQTVDANARFFDDDAEDVPLLALSQGIGTILEAGRLVLIATGAGKAPAIRSAIEGELTSSVPASALQLHPKVTFLVDEFAGSMLARVDFYRRERQIIPGYGH